ncbi:MAG: haloacid dehalogenase-like hydrolase [Bacilli bacterium]|nr:haloacid dehalogenase-like hydrolase [Bacilli bacterium]
MTVLAHHISHMNVYDFDETIFYFDSEVLFCRALLESNEVKSEHKQMLLDITSKGDEVFFEKIKGLYWICDDIKDLEAFLEDFWDKNEKYIKPFYKKIRKEDDVISSATPRFILEPIQRRLGFKNLIATELEPKSYKLLHLNKGEGKVTSFKKQYPDGEIECFYSDSDNDLPLAKLAKKAFKVKGDEISPWIF